MSGVFPPGTRPDQWSTLGDHQRRLQALEAVPCCFDSGLGPNTTYSDLVLANPCLSSYWPMDDAGPGAADVFGALDLTENPTGTTFSQPVGSQGAFSFAYEQGGPWPAVPEATSIKFAGNNLASPTGTVLWASLGAGNVLQGAFSAAAWVRIDDVNAHTFWDFYTGTGAFLNLYAFGSGPAQFVFSSASGSLTSTTAPTLGTFYFLVVTSSATSVKKLYVNGVLEDTDTFSSGTSVSTGTLRFGASGTGANGPGSHLNGRQSQTAWFNCVLTQAEISALYAATNEPNLTADAGMVPVADGGGSYSWEFPLEVTY